MDEHARTNDRPLSWAKALGELPVAWRAAAEAHAWTVYDRVYALEAEGQSDVYRRISAATTAISPLVYASFVPLHLAPDDRREELIALMGAQGPHAVLTAILAAQPKADNLMLVGDLINLNHLQATLDAVLPDRPARFLIGGPGPQVEPALRRYAQEHEYGAYHVRGVDSSRGQAWAKGTPDEMGDLVARLYREQRPNRLLVFEPVSLPATVIAVESARRLGLEISYAPAATPAAAPARPVPSF